MFAKMNNPSRSNVTPSMSRNVPMLKSSERNFLEFKIRKNIKEGKPRKQAIAIAFSQARKKFGTSRIPEVKNRRTDVIDKRTRRLLLLIFGTAVALSILRQARN